eukprot:TRINITY_DN13916_c0_g1_i1.p1 TRINITY_DN13916_c0_g1~~TRINITY_DN13916_c0_g1_i1.p1  ORF type:complete len:362 (+),score=99.67 TRINITY_DN13916_c0_g1_i1:146-1231(+)
MDLRAATMAAAQRGMGDVEVIKEKYIVRKCIGSGAFGHVREVIDRRTRVRYAAKLSFRLVNSVAEDRTMANEIELYKRLGTTGRPGVPTLHDSGIQDDRVYIIMDLLGPCLEQLQKYCGVFTPKTLMLLGMQMLQLVKNVHDLGFVHRDIKPANFSMGVGDKGNIVYLIDFGLAKKITKIGSAMRAQVAAPGGGHNLRRVSGTPLYLSVAAHEQAVTDQAGDLEQLCYTMATMANGRLPWSGMAKEDIFRAKKACSTARVMGSAPAIFHELLDVTRQQELLAKPSYDVWMERLERDFAAAGFTKDWAFDWFTHYERRKAENTALADSHSLSLSASRSRNTGSRCALGSTWQTASSLSLSDR